MIGTEFFLLGKAAEKERRAAEKQAKKVQEIMAANTAPRYPDCSPPQHGRKAQKRAPDYASKPSFSFDTSMLLAAQKKSSTAL